MRNYEALPPCTPVPKALAAEPAPLGLSGSQPLTVVTLKPWEMAQKIREGFFQNMKPCVYNPASRTLKIVALC